MALRAGPVSELEICEVAASKPGPHEVCVKVMAAGVSFVDELLISGAHHNQMTYPYVPGTECAGIVEVVGHGVSEFVIGDAVCGVTLPGGSFAEYVTVAASALTKAPKHIPFAELAVFAASYSTSYHALVQRARATRGELMVVRGAAGALGMAAVQLGRLLGLRVIASASTEVGRATALVNGAEAVIDSTSSTWRDDLQSCSREPVDILFDPVGGDGAEMAFRALGWGGRHLVLGFASGSIPSLRFNLPLVKGAALIGVDAAQFMRREPDVAKANMRLLMNELAAGKLSPQVACELPFDSFKQAVSAAKKGTVGRVVLTVGDDGRAQGTQGTHS